MMEVVVTEAGEDTSHSAALMLVAWVEVKRSIMVKVEEQAPGEVEMKVGQRNQGILSGKTKLRRKRFVGIPLSGNDSYSSINRISLAYLYIFSHHIYQQPLRSFTTHDPCEALEKLIKGTYHSVRKNFRQQSMNRGRGGRRGNGGWGRYEPQRDANVGRAGGDEEEMNRGRGGGRGGRRGNGGRGRYEPQRGANVGRVGGGEEEHFGQGRGGGGAGRGRDEVRREELGRTGNELAEGGNIPRKEYTIGFKKLDELVAMDRKDALIYLNNSRNNFTRLLNEEKRPDWIERVSCILVECAEEKTTPEILSSVLTMVTNSKFINPNLTELITSMVAEKSLIKHQQYKKILKAALRLFEVLMLRMPGSSFHQIFPCNTVLKAMIPLLKINTEIIDDELMTTVSALGEQLEHHLKHSTPKTEENKSVFDEQAPPDDFRQLPTIPRKEDLHIEEAPFLRVNKSTGAYIDVDHYLDVQYRLLREDFISPLRDGIEEYLQRGSRRPRTGNVIVYDNVRFVKPECTAAGIVYIIQLDLSGKLSRTNWKTSKRLIFGSLVCLSKDNFETFLFATIHDRKVEVLESRGQISVHLPDLTYDKDQCRFESSYTMLETSAYFESYRHVLKGLQEIDRDKMPFVEHIVFCSTKVEPPAYMKRTSTFDFRAIFPDDTPLRTKEAFKETKILEQDFWPHAEHLGLDVSQRQALINAMTKKMSIIQGPPGTGKTFLGLKVVKLLLSNFSVWAEDEHRPILVVCYTNHALDQFLEGILRFTDASEIVRVGGRSKSAELEACMLSTLRRNVDKRDTLLAGTFQALRDNRDQLTVMEHMIKSVAAATERASNGFLTLNELVPFLSQEQADWFFDSQTGSDRLKEWLGFDFANVEQILRNEEREKKGIVDAEGDEELNIDDEVKALEEERELDVDNDWDIVPVQAMLQLSIEDTVLEQEDDEAWSSLNRAQKRAVKNQLRRRLANRDTTGVDEIYAETVENPWRLNIDYRWRLYHFWVGQYLVEKNKEMKELHENYTNLIRQRNEINNEKDTKIMRNAKVIGMTTTGCARSRQMIANIAPKIIVVEEAAEVLEAHIVTSLSEGCEHLIMIGDHKQLRPNPAVYRLVKKFNLDISLFERMVKNKLPYVCLRTQHRMRLEISRPMRFIYPELLDADSVKEFKDIYGVSSNLFFIDHGYLESSDSEERSHSNKHEAEFLVQLCRYLIHQGYDPSKITILTPYYGQLLEFRKYIEDRSYKSQMADVLITVVDNFQGEENDIILLSLVRSNSDGNIGFVGVENRICVALSRARHGLFIIGNMQLLRTKADLWLRLEEHWKREGRIGECLTLKCQNHSDLPGVMVKTAVDFDKVSEGGCTLMCEFRLPCGHTCPRQCHIYDREHIDMSSRCQQPCARTSCGNPSHKCTKRCSQDCGTCQVLVDKILPRCGHKQKVKCGENLDVVVCKQPCNLELPCGHSCAAGCSRPHTERCSVLVSRKLPCTHAQNIFCSKPIEDAVCTKACTSTLQCEHACSGNCNACHGGHLHQSCTSKCGRTLVCGHPCKQPCMKECPPCEEKCQNRCLHSKCQKKCGEYCTPCKERCDWRCRHYACSKLCHEVCDRPRCNKPCPKQVPPRRTKNGTGKSCGHPCIGLCGEPCPRICRICDKSIVEEIFFGDEDEHGTRFVELSDCGHVFSVKGLDTWMDGVQKDNSVQMKRCPKCQVAIRQHLRYGNVVKQLLSDVERVKEKIRGDPEDNMPDVQAVRKIVNDAVTFSDFDMIRHRMGLMEHPQPTYPRMQSVVLHLKDFISGESPDRQPRAVVSAMRVKADALEKMIAVIVKLRQEMTYSGFGIGEFQTKYDRLTRDLEQLAVYIHWSDGKDKDRSELRCVFAEQQLVDIEWHLNKIQQLASFSILEMVAKRRAEVEVKTRTQRARCFSLLTDCVPFRQKQYNEVRQYLIDIRKECNVDGLGITETERTEILRAINVPKGHWYKCPRGHVYAIGECGGAMQESRCPECGAAIGGSNHRLTAGNAVATEMDGARYAAWSDQANMRNYEF